MNLLTNGIVATHRFPTAFMIYDHLQDLLSEGWEDSQIWKRCLNNVPLHNQHYLLRSKLGAEFND